MSVKILFFANLRDRAGTKSLDIEIPEGITVQGLKEQIARDYPNLKQSMEAVLISIDREYAFDEAIVADGSEVAMFPPVSGG